MEQPGAAPRPAYASEILLRLAPPDTPEDRLMLAVMLDAVALLREHAAGVCPHPRRVVSDTARWFASADETWPLSFVNVCRGLGLDPAALRASLERELADLGARAVLGDERAEVVPLRTLAASGRGHRGRQAASPRT
jgi:hypothetical protein